MNTENHDQQAQGDNDQQSEAEPAQDHGRGAHPTPHAPVPQVLDDRRSRHRRGVLPHDADQHEDRGDEDGGQRDLADGAGGEGLHFGFGAAVGFGVPAGEGGEEEEGQECEDDGHDSA